MSGQQPRCMSLFQRRIDGDESLQELASNRFRDAGMGPEYYADSPDELAWLLRFKPWAEAPTMVHLSRDIDLITPEGRENFLNFAQRFSHDVSGFVLHDREEMTKNIEGYLTALTEINRILAELPGKPLLFIEYAVGLAPDIFCSFIEGINHLAQISACLDIGHIGIKAIQNDFQKNYPNRDVCAFTPNDPNLPDYLEAIQKSVRSAGPAVKKVITRLAKLNKPLHFHLHDGHPLSTFSPFGISDHLSFFQTINLPFSFKRKKSLGPMFGPKGLSGIIKKTMALCDPALLSFSLEIHPTDEQAPLEEWPQLFQHWQDKTNAEKQNHWLTTLIRNHELLQKTIETAS